MFYKELLAVHYYEDFVAATIWYGGIFRYSRISCLFSKVLVAVDPIRYPVQITNYVRLWKKFLLKLRFVAVYDAIDLSQI